MVPRAPRSALGELGGIVIGGCVEWLILDPGVPSLHPPLQVGAVAAEDVHGGAPRVRRGCLEHVADLVAKWVVRHRIERAVHGVRLSAQERVVGARGANTDSYRGVLRHFREGN